MIDEDLNIGQAKPYSQFGKTFEKPQPGIYWNECIIVNYSTVPDLMTLKTFNT